MNVLRWLMTVAVLMSLSIGRALAGETATAVATITAGFVSGITVTSGGSGYTSEPWVFLSGGGGNGATAKAILSGDKVVVVVVLTPGSGYTTAPTVMLEAPPKPLGVRLELVPKLTVEGPAGSVAQEVQSAESLTAPWTSWTNVTVGAEGTVLVDLSPGSAARFYRAVAEQHPGFVWIVPGTFVMGSPLSEADRFSDEVLHTVTLTQGFWISDHETTQAEYQLVMGSNPSNLKGESLPVEAVSWNDAVAYCQKLTERERAWGRITSQQAYRLPTEAEWEYAARAGTTGSRYGELDAIAWWSGNSGNQLHPVKQKAANALGLYDMMGNVWEWCSDWYGAYPSGSVTNQMGPMGPSSGSFRVFRGGSWSGDARYARSACRYSFGPGVRSNNLGFRPALSGGGGSGATAKTILSGDKVALTSMLTAGSGYSTAPTVVVEAPTKQIGVRLELVRKLTVEGPAGSNARVESAASLTGPWTTWTNVTVGAEGTVLVDLSPGSAARFYRAVADKVWLVPAGMALIPAGPFQMGDHRVEGLLFGDHRVEGPEHTVTVSAFAMDKCEVSLELWKSVRAWGNTHGYDLLEGGGYAYGEYKHPVNSVSWFNVVKWNNARSEKEGKVPAYYVDAAMTQVYRSGEKAPAGVKWDSGYRLPTEAEWEKAARGGVAGKLYPWGTDAISTALANYMDGSKKSESMIIGSYGANGYGLYDMAGNVWEWCWDWYGDYSSTAQTDPRGPSSGSSDSPRVIRGGSWLWSGWENCRVAARNYSFSGGYYLIGFRSVLPPGQP